MTATKVASRNRAVPAPPATGVKTGAASSWGRTRKTSWMTLGILLTGGAALVAMLMLNAAGSRVTVLVAAHDLAPGKPISASDLRTVAVSADESLKAVPAAKANELVGRVPLVTLGDGTLLTPGLFSSSTSIAAGETVVGASLSPGDVPGQNLRAGDHVALVQVASNNPSDSAGPQVLTLGTVFTVDTAKNGDVVVSLRVPLDRGAASANAAGQKRLRLILVPADTTIDQVQDTPTTGATTKSATSGTSPAKVG